MTSPSDCSRLRRFVSHLTYANVVATLALVAATSSGAYAAAHINGHSIAKHSLPANRLTRGAVVSRAVVAGRVDHLLVTHGRLRKARKHLASARGTSHDVSGATGTMVSIATGSSATLFQSGPFTLVGSCVAGDGGIHLRISGSATEAWFTGDNGDGTSHKVAAGDSQVLYDDGQFDHPYAFTVLNSGVIMLGDDGHSLVLGDWTGTYNIYGDCTFSGTALAS